MSNHACIIFRVNCMKYILLSNTYTLVANPIDEFV